MINISNKTDGVDTLAASEFNDLKNEIQNVITSSGLALTTADLAQLGKAVAMYSAGADYYTDTGTVNTYVLGAVGSKQTPSTYFLGMRVRFLPTNANTGASTVNVAGLGAKAILRTFNPTQLGDITTGRHVELVYNGSEFSIVNAGDLGASASTFPISAGGRLTISSSDPVGSGTGSTIYYLPYNDNRLSLWNGSTWSTYAFTSISAAVPAAATQIYDVWGFITGGAPALEFTGWTNDTTRATALTRHQGVLVKSGDATRRYLGTIRTGSSAGVVHDTTARRFVWNYYNRINRKGEGTVPTASWVYDGSTPRACNANTTEGEGRVALVVGVLEEAVQIRSKSTVETDSASPVRPLSAGFGVNSTTVLSGYTNQHVALAGNAIIMGVSEPFELAYAGFHYIQNMEDTNGTPVNTWYGNSTDTNAIGFIARM